MSLLPQHSGSDGQHPGCGIADEKVLPTRAHEAQHIEMFQYVGDGRHQGKSEQNPPRSLAQVWGRLPLRRRRSGFTGWGIGKVQPSCATVMCVSMP